jgi:all-trans-8'-apo-beta-carotenal 15,15'-oxygenase
MKRLFRSQPDEHAFEISRVEGTLPHDLDGTFLRTGPGLLQLGDDQLNFFDGHALIAGVSCRAGRARFRSRFVHSPLLEAETTQRRVLKRRIFTNRPQRWLNLFALSFGNSAMHDVYAWGDGEQRRVIAGHDLGHFALDPHTLATIGPESWGGAVSAGMQMGPMPDRDPHTGHLVTWIKQEGSVRPDALSFVELDGSFRVVKQTPFMPLAAAPALVHDQRATQGWYVATEQALRLQPLRALWGAHTVYESLATPPGVTATLLLVSRNDPTRSLRVPLPAPFEIAFHVINAFDEGELVHVDLVVYGARIGFEAAAPRALRERTGQHPKHGPPPMLMRFSVDPSAGRVTEARKLGGLPGDAPEVAAAVMGSAYRYAYLPTLGAQHDVPDQGAYFYYNALGKLDVQTGAAQIWQAGPEAVVSPCSFVARPSARAEDDGWLLSYVLRESGAEVVVLDAQAIDAGPVATLQLGIHLPGVSHVRWAGDVQLE